MSKRILIVHGHPDASKRRFNHALAEAYALGAEFAGHHVEHVDVAKLEFPWLRSRAEWEGGTLSDGLARAQQAIGACEHLVFFYPLWLGGMPAMLKGFLEHIARPGFAFAEGDGFPKKLLSGRSARVVVTMGMPAPVYRWYFRAHSLKALERNILGFVGIAPIRETLIGSVEKSSEKERMGWLTQLNRLGHRAD
jgi:putative NADPH-quinone reductase